MKRLREFLSKEETSQAVIAKQTEDYYGHLYLGNMYMALSQFHQAVAEYQRAHAIRPGAETEAKIANARAQIAAQRQSGTTGFGTGISHAA